ncbi:MAG: HAMP domain-containing sensor histidine kinase, partial [Bacteroidota bacterium]
RVRWGLIGSLGIIFLTSISFWIMMHTIKKQKKLSQIKDDFIDNISHELQTPISILKVALEGLEKYRALEDPQKTKTYLNLSQSELKRLSLLVSQVLKSSIYENAHPHLSREYIDLKEILDNLAFIYSLKSDKPLLIDYVIPEELPQIQSNALALRQILENIIDNAIKYNHQPQVKLQIKLEYRPGDLKISLRDNGPGISPDEQERIFEKFYRVSQKNDHSIKGFGIGLYYVKQLVEKMGGQISVASKVGEGSTFTLYFKDIAYAIP